MKREIQKLADDFIRHKVSIDYFALNLVAAIIAGRNNHPEMISLAQAIFFMAPESGDGA